MLLKYGKILKETEIRDDGDLINIDIDGIPQNIKLERIANGEFIVRGGIKENRAFAVKSKNRIFTWIGGVQYVFELAQKDFSNSNEGSGEVDKEIIYPPMPGMIVKVLKNENETVDEGEAVLIIEAMKMETTLYSSIKGVIKKINVKQGMQVDSDLELAIIEK